MRIIAPAAALFLPLALAACGHENSADDPVVITHDDPAPSASPSTLTSAPGPDCVTVKGSADQYNLLGVVVGMKPSEAAAILTCRGYVVIFPKPDDPDDQRRADQEAKQGTFRYEFAKADDGDQIRIMAEGPASDRHIYYIGREKTFDTNPPTLEAVAQQFTAAYHPEIGPVRDHYGFETGHITYATDLKGKSPEAATRECFRAAIDSMGVNELCGLSMTFKVIENGRNENLAYVARYALQNPIFAFQLRQARIQAESNAANAELDDETRKAETSGSLPSL